MLTPSESARLEELQADLALLKASAQNVQGALRNRTVSTYSLGATTPGQATITGIAACKLIAQMTGLFYATVVLEVAAVAADSVTPTLQNFTDNVAGTPLTINNGTISGTGTNGFAQPGNVLVNTNGSFFSNAAAGITLTGSTQIGPNVYNTAQTVGTAATGYLFNWAGIIHGGGAQAAAVPLGQTCCLLLSITNSVAARAINQLAINMWELP